MTSLTALPKLRPSGCWSEMLRKPSCSSCWARLSGPTSMGRSPPSAASCDTLSLAASSSPATRTSSCWPVTSPAASVPAKLVLQAFTTGVPLRDKLLDLLGSGGARWRRQPVPGLGVDGVGDVDDGLAGELIGVLADGVLDAGIVDGEDDHLAAERSPGIERGGGATEVLGEPLRICRVAVDDLDLVASRDDAGSDAAAHVACTNDRHACRGAASSGSRRAHQLPCPASTFTNRTARSPWRRSAAPVQPPTWQLVQPTTRSRNGPCPGAG